MSRKKSNGIRQTDPPKTPKVWEKARREKMKIYFNELQEVLPLYDPSAPMSRFEILQKSRMYIKELQSQNQDLLNGGFDEVFKNKMEKLKQRVKELLQRVDQLTDLLRRANIMIPPLVPCPGKQENISLSQKWMNQRPKKWTEKINVIVPDEKIENILSLIKNFKKKNSKINVGKRNCKAYENVDENKVQSGSLAKDSTFSESIELKKKKELKKIKTSKIDVVNDASSSKNDKNNSDTFTDSPSHTKENQPVDFNLPASDEFSVKVSECNNVDRTDQNKSGSVEKVRVQSKMDTKITDNDEKINVVTGKVKNVIEPQNNVFLPVSNSVMQPNTYLLTNDGNLVHFPILNSSGNMFGTNSNLLTQTAIVNQQNSGLLTPLVINRPSPVIVLQKPGPQLIQATQIVNPAPQILSVPNPNIQILGNSVVCATSSQSSNSKTLPYILSKQPANKKRLAKDSTMTTYVNKIPIPALSKQSYVKKAISLNNCVGTKGKNFQYKVKDGKEKLTEGEKSNANESESEISVNEKEIQTDKCTEACTQQEETAKEKEKESENVVGTSESSTNKRSITSEDNTNAKKQKVISENSEENFFKPIIENPIVSDPPTSSDNLFCNLKLPNAVTHNLSVSPTAAFLSTFPIVATSKFEVEDEITAKMIERRPCEDKNVGLCEDKETKRKNISAEPSESIQDSRLSEVTKVILPNKESPESSKFTNEDKIINSSNSPIVKSTSDINAVSGSLNTSISSGSINNVSITAAATANNNNNNNNNNNSNSNNNNNAIVKENSKSCNSNSNCNNNINNNNSHCSKNSNNTSNSNNSDNNSIAGSDTLCSQLVDVNKSWHDFNHGKNCDIRTDPFYIHSEIVNSVPSPVITNVLTNTLTSFTDTAANNSAIYKTSYSHNNMKTNFDDQNNINEQITLKNNQFDYAQKENFINKRMSYNGERQMMKKLCTNNLTNDTYTLSKNPSDMYQTESNINCQLIPTKEISNQRNSRPPVNWMTDPDIRSRSMSYSSQPDKMPSTKIPPFNQPDIFCMNNQNAKPQSDVPGDYVLSDVNKMSYQKNDYYMNKNIDVQMKQPDQRCKNVEKRSESKFSSKSTQNSYNIFDYNYNGNYFGDDEANKFCNLQNFPCNPVKNKKTNNLGVTKKKADVTMHLINSDQHPNDSHKRNPDHLSNMDFNSVGNQECFSWVPGKNVDWLPSKSFVDNNLILPSTLPTLVGDLALGTTTSSEIAQTKGNGRINQTKTGLESGGKSYIDLGLCNNAPFPKPLDPAPDKQYLEPFTNLSKNIFDLTPTNNVQNSQLLKTDCEKNGYISNTNETIVLKNIFELPVSKSFTNDFANRNKQRNVNNTQNTFLSVSQLVETPNYENTIKAEAPMENNVAKPSDTYAQNYSAYHGSQKSYKNKNRNPHYKYNDRKYLGYKNTSSNYTAEALIRSNANLSYQSNEFQPELNSNFYNMKNPQKPENFLSGSKNDFESLSKTDFAPCSTQNIYADFNFSSPVPNFNISTSVSTDYIGHDGNFSSQNNSFFGDFIPPEYPITESVSNSLLLPPCSIGLQNPFIIEKRNATPEKSGKSQGKTYSNSRSRKNFDCSKTSYNDFTIGHNSSAGIFTNAGIACPTIFTTTSCQNLLPVPNQNIPDPNITFSAPSFTTANIPFPTLPCNGNANYHRSANALQNSTAATFFPSTCHSTFTTCSTTAAISSRACTSIVPAASSSSAVITTSFSVGSTHFPPSTQSGLPILSLSNPIIPPSVPSTSGNSLANFNLSTIFPEINQKGNYHYP